MWIANKERERESADIVMRLKLSLKSTKDKVSTNTGYRIH